jgi:hypothetical protein
VRDGSGIKIAWNSFLSYLASRQFRSDSGSDGDDDSEEEIDVIADLEDDVRARLVADTEKIKKILLKVCQFLFHLSFVFDAKFTDSWT